MGITVIGNIKGGVGKTTVAVNLAMLSSINGNTVLLIDADEQESASDFTAIRNEVTDGKAGYTCVSLRGKAVRTETLELSKRYDNTFIDVGGRNTDSIRAALTIAETLLVPFLPTSLDLWGLEHINQLLEESLIYNPHLTAYCFLNRADAVGNDNSESADIAKNISNLNYIDVSLGNRKAFRNAITEGVCVVEYKPKDDKAITEMQELYWFLFRGK